MNGIILIRQGKVAFARYPGDYGDDGNIAFDLKDLITPHGLFIPVNNAGTQVIPMLNSDKLFNALDIPDSFSHVSGDKGLLIAPIPGRKVQFNRIRLSANKKLNSGYLAVGEGGFAVLSEYGHLVSTMAMCVHLTATIEETVEMYARHAKTNRAHVVIMDSTQLYEFIETNWKPEFDKDLENILSK